MHVPPHLKRMKMVALLAMAVLAMAAGSAHAAEFRAGKYPATLLGEQTGTATGEGTILAFESQMTECGTGGFNAELTGTSSTISITPTGSVCTAFGFSSAEMTLNGCGYKLHIGSGSKDEFSGTVDVVCPAGNSIAVVGGTCEVRIPAQTALGTISYENLTATTPAPGVKVVFNVHNFSYTKTKDGFLCPLNGTGAGSDGTLVGITRVSATNSGNPVSFWIE